MKPAEALLPGTPLTRSMLIAGSSSLIAIMKWRLDISILSTLKSWWSFDIPCAYFWKTELASLSNFGSHAGGQCVIQGYHQQIKLPVSPSNLMTKTKPRVRKGLLFQVSFWTSRQKLCRCWQQRPQTLMVQSCLIWSWFSCLFVRLLPRSAKRVTMNKMLQVWCSHLGSGPDCQVRHKRHAFIAMKLYESGRAS